MRISDWSSDVCSSDLTRMRLFEIEKAHPRILDKFLQILDDGVLTSGRGDRVYFSEALIIFTSNLGLYATGPDGERRANVTSDHHLEGVESQVGTELEKHLKIVFTRTQPHTPLPDTILLLNLIHNPLP